jgi:hypothetical protein
MKVRTTALRAVAVAGISALCSCRKEIKPFEPVAQIPAPTGDTNFTPPEILRSASSADTAKAEPVRSVATAVAVGHPKTDSAQSGRPETDGAKTGSPETDGALSAHLASPVKAPKAAPAPPTPVTAPAPPPKIPVAGQVKGDPGTEGDWVLQVGIQKKADADARIAKFAAEGIPAYAIPVPTDGAGLAGQYWRVRVGRFTSRAAAQAFADKRLVPEGLKPWIDRKTNESRSDGTP